MSAFPFPAFNCAVQVLCHGDAATETEDEDAANRLFSVRPHQVSDSLTHPLPVAVSLLALRHLQRNGHDIDGDGHVCVCVRWRWGRVGVKWSK